jgi:hypothetical protein
MSETNRSLSLNDDLTPEQFERLRASGSINLRATYADYLQLKRERNEAVREAAFLGLTGDEPPELTEEDEAILDIVWAELRHKPEAAVGSGVASSVQDLQTKWPRAQFEELKSRHYFHSSTSYEDYLDMRREQEEIAEEGRRLGLTGDEPPELTEEDEAIFDRIWAEQGRKAELKRKLEALQAKWPREHFERVQAEGLVNTETTYEQYLEMRLEQAERAEEARRLGLTGDEPPELTEEDEAILDRAWAEFAREKQVTREERAA